MANFGEAKAGRVDWIRAEDAIDALRNFACPIDFAAAGRRVLLGLAQIGGTAEMLGDCFLKNAFVRDEEREYFGLPGIKSWKLEGDARYRYEVEPLNSELCGETVILKARMSGAFPKSPLLVN